MLSAVEDYIRNIENALKQGDATEHTHRPFLKALVESLRENVIATNEPKRKGGNAPDFIVLESKVPIGFIETKDVGKRLGPIEKSEQIKRYRESLNNLILTDYLEFRWYVHGELRNSIKLASAMPNGSLMLCFDGENLLLNLLKSFFETQVPSVTTAQDLAERMASRAKILEESVEALLKSDTSPNLRGLMTAFKKDLLPDLDDAKFADLYTQTVAYGLFTARVFTNNPPFNRETAFRNLPKANPFLKKMFQEIAGFDLEDEPHVWAVDIIAKLLDRADMSLILEDFGKGKGKDDPVVHFYETFLSKYNPTLRELRGVYYTPTPVVSYIVRSVDAILKRDFGLPDGIADASKISSPPYEGGVAAASADGVVLPSDTHKVLILDPSTGTGTFLYKIIDLIYPRFAKEPELWKKYVSDHLLPRVFGFELLVAPYSIAHLKLGIRLSETGYEFGSGERLNIFLTNTLDEMDRLAESQTAGLDYWIHEEAYKAQNVKQEAPVMVVLSNPPYSGHSANTGDWIRNLLRGTDTHTGESTENYFEVDGQPLGERNPKWLNNDYVKFIRFSQWRIEKTGEGILAFITSNSYLDSPTFRGMRESLMNTFDEIYILDLHGNSKKKEKAPDGTPDQNVFDITEGVAIGIFVKKREGSNPAEGIHRAMVFHYDLFGVREVYERPENDDQKQLVGGKYKYLRENDKTTTGWVQLEPRSPYYLFVPQNTDLWEEYQSGWTVTDIFPVNSVGIVTSRDRLVFDFDENQLRERMSNFLNSENDVEAKEKYLSKKDKLDIDKTRKAIKADKERFDSRFVKCFYRPFDLRTLFYHDSIIERSRAETMQHLIGKENLAGC